MSPIYLDYEVALLLAKYGKPAVVESLARTLQLDEAEIHTALNELPRSKSAVKQKATSTQHGVLDELVRDNPEKAKHIRTLHDRFHNRTFLPELRDVKRFFYEHSHPFGSAKSRADSLPRLLQLLAELDVAELETLSAVDVSNGYSSLGIISDAILRKHG